MNQRVGVVLVCLIALFPGSVAAYLLDVSASWQEPFEGTSDSDSASVSSGSAQAFVIAQQGGNSIGFSGLGIADADASGAHTQTQASISAVSTSNNAEIVSASTQWSTTISNISLDSQSWLFSYAVPTGSLELDTEYFDASYLAQIRLDGSPIWSSAAVLSDIGLTETGTSLSGTLTGANYSWDALANSVTFSVAAGSSAILEFELFTQVESKRTHPFSDLPGGTAVFNSGIAPSLSQVPLPAAVWLFGSGLLGLVGMARRKKA